MNDSYPYVQRPDSLVEAMTKTVESKLQVLVDKESNRVFHVEAGSLVLSFESETQIGVAFLVSNNAFKNKDLPAQWRTYPKQYVFQHIYNVENAHQQMVFISPINHEMAEDLKGEGRDRECFFWKEEVNEGEKTFCRFEKGENGLPPFTAEDFTNYSKIKDPSAKTSALGVLATALRFNAELWAQIARDAYAAADNKKLAKTGSSN